MKIENNSSAEKELQYDFHRDTPDWFISYLINMQQVTNYGCEN